MDKTMTLPLYAPIDVYEYQNGSIIPKTLMVSTEYPVRITVNGQLLANIACSGSDIDSLVTGFLLSEGIISSVDEIASINFNDEELAVTVLLQDESKAIEGGVQKIVTGGGRGKIIDIPGRFKRKKPPSVKAEVILNSIDTFLHTSKLRDLTHGFHAAALYTLEGGQVIFFDEIGRHSAIDKVVGYAARNSISMSDKIIFSTGRISSEIAAKIIYSGVPVFVSRASPTIYAAELMKKYGIVFICRASKKGFTLVEGLNSVILKTTS